MDNYEQMDIPEEFPSSAPISTFQSIIKQHPKREIEYFKSSKNNKSVAFKENIDHPHKSQPQQKRESKGKNIKEFLDFQESFLKQKEDNLCKLKESRDSEQARQCTGHPSINSHSRKLTSHLVEPYYHRLSKSKSKNREDDKNSFMPQISTRSKSLERQKNVSEILYGDALRRIQKENINQLQKSMKDVSQPKTNANTDRLIAKSLRAQFQEFALGTKQFTPILSLSIISNIFNVDLNSKKDSSSTSICSRITKLLFGKSKKVSEERLWGFIQVVVGGEEALPAFKPEEVKYIKKHFGNLYRNRMTKPRKQGQEKIPTFRPEILKNSERLAQKKRSKLLQQAQRLNLINTSGSGIVEVPISDLYLMERICKQEESRCKKLQQQEEKQAKQCTFKPALTEWKGCNQCIVASTKSSRKRLEHLKTLVRYETTLTTMKTQYSTNSFKDKQASERNSVSKENHKDSKSIKNLDLAVQRMSAARQQREFANEFMQRGYPKNIKNYQQYRKSQKKSITKSHEGLKGHPETSSSKRAHNQKDFIFDIHINTGVIETIRLKSDDNPVDIVRRLSHKHNLQEGKKQKLFEMISHHIAGERV